MREGLRPSTGWTSLVLLTCMLLVVAWSVQAASWAEGLGILTGAVLGGVLASLVLAKFPWMPSSLAHAWAVVLGFLWTLFLGTRVAGAYFPDTELGQLPLTAQMAAVRDTVAGWLVAVRTGASAEASAYIFVLATAFLVWLLTYVSVRFLVKYSSFWGAVLPAGVALVANLYYAKEAPPVHLALFLLCALLLAALTSVAVNEDYWRQARIPYSPDIGLDFLKDGAVIAVAVLALGWIAPAEVRSAPLTSVVDTMSGASGSLQTQFNRLFPDINYPSRGSGGAYTDAMPLSGAISLGTTPIFDVRVAGDLVPRYWRMAVFDTYDGAGWRRSDGSEIDLEPTGADSVIDQAGAGWSVPVTQTVETLQPITSQLVSAPQPASFDIPARAHMGEGAGGTGDIMAVRPAHPLSVGDTYDALSLVSVADTASLRTAGDADPEWVRNRYLALPASPDLEIVAAKAAEIAGVADNRYDKADLIENWLRSTIPYNEDISTPPEGRDRVAWFLFDEKQGYCDYYSSAFVVMARSLQIPARVAAGYSLGEFIEGKYRQRAYDAHSWPEVYFPGIGWVEFEPTAADAEIARSEGPGDTEPTPASPEAALQDRDTQLPEEDLPAPADPLDPQGGQDGPLGGRLPVGLLLVAGLGLAMATAGARYAWQRQFAGLDAPSAAYARVARAASWLGLGPQRADTPFEFGRRLGSAVPDAREPIEAITGAYVHARFARAPQNAEPAGLTRAWSVVRRAMVQFVAATSVSRVKPRWGGRLGRRRKDDGRP